MAAKEEDLRREETADEQQQQIKKKVKKRTIDKTDELRAETELEEKENKYDKTKKKEFSSGFGIMSDHSFFSPLISEPIKNAITDIGFSNMTQAIPMKMENKKRSASRVAM